MFGIAALITNDVEEFSEYIAKVSVIHTILLQRTGSMFSLDTTQLYPSPDG